MKLKDTGLTVQDIKDKVSKHMSVSISWQRPLRACISMMKKELHTSIFMQELQ